jgi:hypothetical protein
MEVVVGAGSEHDLTRTAATGTAVLLCVGIVLYHIVRWLVQCIIVPYVSIVMDRDSTLRSAL